MISSTLISKNYQKNFQEIGNSENYFICQIEEKISNEQLCEINSYLIEEMIGKVLVICNGEGTAFTVIYTDLDKTLKVIKRLLREFGVWLGTEIMLFSSELKILKENGKQ